MIKKLGKMKNRKEVFLITLGIFLLILWVFETIYKINTYGISDLLWFCSISLLLLSIALILKSSTLIMSFLPIAIEAQGFWIADYFLKIFNFNSITKSADYMFDFVQTPLEFLIGLKHLFIIPLGLLALKQIKKPANRFSWVFCIILGVIIIIVPYIFSIGNVNCALHACWDKNNLSYNINYSIIFFIISFIICILIFYIPLNYILNKSKKDSKLSKIFNYIIILFFIIALSGVILGLIKYNSIPHYGCLNKESNIVCEKAYRVLGDSIVIKYKVDHNYKKCNITAYSNSSEIASSEYIFLNKSRTGFITLPPPKKNTEVLLKAECE